MTASTNSTSPRANPRGSVASYDNAKVVNRFDLTKRLVAKLEKDEAVIGGVGNTNFDLWSAGRRPQNFYMLGSMGLAIPIALGVALAQPKRHVIALEGDGSLLMQLGTLATIAGARPRNLTHLLFKNGVYHTSGSQDIPGGLTVDFVQMAKGAGYRKAYAVSDFEDFKRRLPSMLTDEGPLFVELHTGLADKTPMTDRGGQPFHQQVESLFQKLRKAG